MRLKRTKSLLQLRANLYWRAHRPRLRRVRNMYLPPWRDRSVGALGNLSQRGSPRLCNRFLELFIGHSAEPAPLVREVFIDARIFQSGFFRNPLPAVLAAAF